jgi:putative Mg2+ transporter-C (MgtC) family protein
MDAVISFLNNTTVDFGTTLFRLALSFVLGGLIGLEREWHRQSAGLRTHIVICIGSTLLTLLSIYIPQTFTHFEGGDPARIAAQIVSGIGFLGGGAIFRLGANVRGLTTAASIWVAAGIGMVVGAGMYAAAVIGTGIILFALFVMIPFEKRLFPNLFLRSLEIAMNGGKLNMDKISPILEKEGIVIKSLDVSQSFEEKTVRMRLVVRVPEKMDWANLYMKLGNLEGVSKINLDQRL